MNTTPFVDSNMVSYSETDGAIPVDGMYIRIVNNSNNSIEFRNSDINFGCILNGRAVLHKYHFIDFVWDFTSLRFIEVGRNF